MTLEPYTAVLFASYGGPNESADVLPFMRNATAGRGIPDERLIEVSKHYELFGGRSPINELNAALCDLLFHSGKVLAVGDSAAADKSDFNCLGHWMSPP